MKRFESKGVVDIGATSGDGAACVRRLRKEGAPVPLADQDQSGIDKRVADLRDDNRIFRVCSSFVRNPRVAAT